MQAPFAGMPPEAIRAGAGQLTELARLSLEEVLAHTSGSGRPGAEGIMADAPELAVPAPPAGGGEAGDATVMSYAGQLRQCAQQLQTANSDTANQMLVERLKQSKAARATQTEDLKVQNEEFEKQVAAAGVAGDVMGCGGTILQALFTVFGVLAAAFTGGASLAFAVTFLAVDAVVQATTGKSMVEHVLVPLAKALSVVATELLKGLGVDASTASNVGNVIGMVAAAVMIVAAMVVGARVQVGKLVSTAVTHVMRQVSQLAQVAARSLRAVQGAAKGAGAAAQVATKASAAAQGVSRAAAAAAKTGAAAGRSVGARAATRLANKLGVKLKDPQMLGVQFQYAATGAEALNAGLQAGGNIAVGVFEKKMGDSLAKNEVTTANIEVVKRMFELAIASWQQIEQSCTEMLQQAVEMQQATAQTCAVILRQAAFSRV
ncbi:type III secretion system translocon subunit SctE [Burkholderia ambifaria]|uniref:type III secretion system translocon subunit SctE n=1 Tax=Burkholderia ambifaria TaxID=152480 RepID=UPI0015929698|nr:type III secretion system translocon subunit SctE [Burkholderia ambifaria]